MTFRHQFLPALLAILAIPAAATYGAAYSRIIPNPEATMYDQFAQDVAVWSDTIAISSPSRVYLTDLDGNSLRLLPTVAGRTARQVAFNGSGDVAVGNGHHVDIFDARTGELKRTLSNPLGTTAEFGVRLTGSKQRMDHRLLISGASETVHLYNTSDGKLLRTFSNPRPTETGFGRALGLYDNHVVVSSGSGDRAAHVYVFDATTGELRNTFEPPEQLGGFGHSVAVTSSNVFVSSPFDFHYQPEGQSFWGRVDAFNVHTGAPVYSIINPIPGDTSRGVKTDDFFATSLAAEDDRLLVGVDGNTVEHSAYVFNSDSGALLYAFENPDSTVHYGPVDISGDTIVVGDTASSASARFAGAAYVGAVPEPQSVGIWGILLTAVFIRYYRSKWSATV